MLYLFIKAAVSGILIAIISEVAKRYPGVGGLIASLPLLSVLGMIWLWRDRPDVENMAAHSQATFWFVLPSLPMFLVIPWLLRNGMSFWLALLIGCGVTIALYTGMLFIGSRQDRCRNGSTLASSLPATRRCCWRPVMSKRHSRR
jgi:uncharacterized membrane protein (GlpM family)